MRNCDIAKVAGLSNATIYKILYLKDKSKYKFKKETIAKVMWLRNINDFLDTKFKSKTFVDLCDIVIKKITKRQSKNYITIIDLARSCKNLNQKKNHGIVRQIFFKAYDVFTDAEFSEMCMFAVSRSTDREIRELAFELAELSNAFRKKLKIK